MNEVIGFMVFFFLVMLIAFCMFLYVVHTDKIIMKCVDFAIIVIGFMGVVKELYYVGIHSEEIHNSAVLASVVIEPKYHLQLLMAFALSLAKWGVELLELVKEQYNKQAQ